MSQKITLCAIMKNEGPFVIEWIAFHRSIGFNNIVIYDNYSDDGSTELFAFLQQQKIIEHVVWPTKEMIDRDADVLHINAPNYQETAYNDCLSRCHSEWMFPLDADEFFIPKADSDINQFLSRFDLDVGAIGVNWKVFGSSGYINHSPRPVLERFILSSDDGHSENRHIKTIARVKDTHVFGTHMAILKHGKYVNAENKEISIVNLGLSSSPTHEIAQINHYVIKSKQEYLIKKRRGSAGVFDSDPRKFEKLTMEFFKYQDHSDVVDRSAHRFLADTCKEAEFIKRICDRRGVALPTPKIN